MDTIILVFGYKGEIVGAGTYDEICAKDETIRSEGRGYPHLTHHAEVSFLQEPKALTTHYMDVGYHGLIGTLRPVYQQYGKYGDFGDVMYVIKAQGFYYLVAIGRKAYRLPAIAADLIPIVIDSAGNKFFVGIIRGDNGDNATIGGFMDIVDCEWESAVQCVVHEALEEAGLRLRLLEKPSYEVTASPMPESALAEFSLLGETGITQLTRLGIFYSPESNLRPEFDTKRVHAAVGYVVPIQLRQEVTADELLEALVPQDKAENTKVFIHPVNEANFGLMSGHQHMYDLAREFVMPREPALLW